MAGRDKKVTGAVLGNNMHVVSLYHDDMLPFLLSRDGHRYF
jgi:hypothetical protein